MSVAQARGFMEGTKAILDKVEEIKKEWGNEAVEKVKEFMAQLTEIIADSVRT